MRTGTVVTGERVSTPEGGFNPTWQRHVAAYALCEPLLPPGPVLDLGCGVGHSFELLSPRETVGVDLDRDALAGQARETVAADMRELPFDPGRFHSVLSVHSLEHVPDPGRVLAEIARILPGDGVAIFVTPNRLTFGKPDEIIDPYHYVEFDSRELTALCEPYFGSVEIQAIAGSDRYGQIVAAEKRRLDELLRLDPLRLRRFIPRRTRQRLYDSQLTRERRGESPAAQTITPEDFTLVAEGLDEALDLVAICRLPEDQSRSGSP